MNSQGEVSQQQESTTRLLTPVLLELLRCIRPLLSQSCVTSIHHAVIKVNQKCTKSPESHGLLKAQTDLLLRKKALSPPHYIVKRYPRMLRPIDAYRTRLMHLLEKRQSQATRGWLATLFEAHFLRKMKATRSMLSTLHPCRNKKLTLPSPCACYTEAQ